MINPWAIVGALLLLAGSNAASFFFGEDFGRDGLIAEQAEAAAKARETEVSVAQNVEAIATAAGAAVAVALNENAGASNASTERIRTVVVPGECRDVDPVSLHELRAGQADINAALGSGLRRIAAAAGARDPGNPP